MKRPKVRKEAGEWWIHHGTIIDGPHPDMGSAIDEAVEQTLHSEPTA